MSEWYSHLKAEDLSSRHVRVTIEDGSVLEGRLSISNDEEQGKKGMSLGSTVLSTQWNERSYSVFPGTVVLVQKDDGCWHSLDGIRSIDVVWDERDWDRIDVKDLRDGDAVVANGRLYKVDVSWVHEDPPQVVTDTPSRMRIDLCLVSCALRRKVKVPAKPGYYKDMLGEFWARAAKPTGDGPWRSVEPDALDQPAKSDKYMANLMPLTPVHFVDGRAPEPGDELASVMRVTSKGVTFTTEAA